MWCFPFHSLAAVMATDSLQRGALCAVLCGAMLRCWIHLRSHRLLSHSAMHVYGQRVAGGITRSLLCQGEVDDIPILVPSLLLSRLRLPHLRVERQQFAALPRVNARGLG